MPDTLWDMRGRVREVKPNAPPSQVDGFINRRIRNSIDKRSWADTLRIGAVVVPNQYNTGTCDLTFNSTHILGTGTAWPVNDKVNTTLVNPITEFGYVEDITPSAMAGIEVGSFLIIEAENPGNMEIVAVTAVGPDKFTARITKLHDAGVSVIASSFAGRQFNSNDYTYTITAVLSATELIVDRAWGSDSITDQPYMVILAYLKITPYTKRMLYSWDPVQGAPLGTEKTWECLNNADPQRSSTGDPQELVNMPPSAAGVMQFEIWPWQTTARAINVVTAERWPKLCYDTDLSPWFINAEVFIAGAIADALRTKVITRDNRQDPYYSLEDAAYWESEFKSLLDEAEQADEGRYMRALSSYEDQARNMVSSYNWFRSHAVSAPGYWEGD